LTRKRWPCTATILGISLSVVLALPIGCERTAVPTVTPAAESNAVRALSIQWIAAMNSKDLEKTLSYYAPDATAYPPNSPAATTPEMRKQVWSQMLALPGFHLDLTASSVEPTHIADLAVETGAFVLSADGKDGKLSASRGKYVCVWKKQPDGSWKAYHDIWNLDQ
jgi:ketosteroid isomerase-like protein